MNEPMAVCQALETLLEVLHAACDRIDFLYCGINDTVEWEVKAHSLRCFELSVYRGGRTLVKTGDVSFTLERSCVTLFDIGKGYAVRSPAGAYSYITFHIGDSLTTPLGSAAELLEHGVIAEDLPVFDAAFLDIQQEFLMKKPYYRRRITLLMEDLVIRLLRSRSEPDNGRWDHRHTDAVEKVLLCLGTHLTENIRLEDIEALTGYTRRYIDRIFRNRTGYTIVQYLTKLRIEAAKKYLLTSTRSVTQIALDCGFESSSYFCRVFRKTVGMSPTGFRDSAMNGI